MLLECDRCGAPLNVGTGARMVKCGYCGTVSRTRRLTTIAHQTPADWTPPPVWTPPASVVAPSKPHSYRTTRSASLWIIIAVLFTGPNLCIIPIIMYAASAPSGSGSSTQASDAPQARGEAWDGRSPLYCGAGDRITLTDRSVSMPGQTALFATGDCVLRLVRCQVAGGRVVMATGDAEIFVEGGSFESDGLAAFYAGTRGQMQIRNASIRAVVGVQVEQNARARIIGGRVEGSRAALSAGFNGRIDVQGTEVVGPRVRNGNGEIYGAEEQGPK